MRLFETTKVKKFFDILERLTGSIPINTDGYRYRHYQTIYTKDSNHIPSTREVFVNRTVRKWMQGKFLILYKKSDLGVTYKQFVSVSSVAYFNDWSSTGHVGVGFIDYVNPYSSLLFGKERFDHNKCLNTEGEWSNGEIHTKLLSIVSMDDVPDKEYVFEAWDFSKYPKRGVKTEKAMEKIKTTISFRSKTEQGAWDKKREYKGILTIGQLIDINNVI